MKRRSKTKNFLSISFFASRWRCGGNAEQTALRADHIFGGNLNSEFWRRERDSNPRYGCPHTRFPSVLLRPLGHLSASEDATFQVNLKNSIHRAFSFQIEKVALLCFSIWFGSTNVFILLDSRLRGNDGIFTCISVHDEPLAIH